MAAAFCGAAACVSDSSATGDAGADATACPSPEVLCGSECVDTSRDPLHCGACNAACDGGTVCSAGNCAASCPTPQTACSGSCVDTTRDALNCGSCGKACGAHMQCANSACAPVLCSTNADCDDGVECNGVEKCDPTSASADKFGCVAGYLAQGDAGATDGGDASVQQTYLVDQDGDGLVGVACGGTDCDDTKYGYGLGDCSNCGTCGHACAVQQACQNGQCVAARRIFVTNGGFDGNFSGVAGADVDCQNAATAANLGGVWKAFIFDQNNGEGRLGHATVPYVRLDGVKVADNWTQLAATNSDPTVQILQAPVNVTELRTHPGGGNVWTGLSNGNLSTTCTNWTTNQNNNGPYGQAGEYNHVDGHWGGFYLFSCASAYHLYCIEQ